MRLDSPNIIEEIPDLRAEPECCRLWRFMASYIEAAREVIAMEKPPACRQCNGGINYRTLWRWYTILEDEGEFFEESPTDRTLLGSNNGLLMSGTHRTSVRFALDLPCPAGLVDNGPPPPLPLEFKNGLWIIGKREES